MISGDFRKMKLFIDRLETVPTKGKLQLSKNLAEETIELIREGFDQEKTPHGRPWRKLKLRMGRILQKTGGMRNSWHRKFSADGFRVRSGKASSIYHQEGTGIYGYRKERIYPKGKRPLRAGEYGPVLRKRKALKLGKYGFAASVAGTPKRQMVPSNRLPAHWRSRYEQVTNQVLKRWFR
jgi:phage gpG-like protein